MNTVELTGALLDYWVAKAEGMLFVHDRTDGGVTAQENVGGHVYNYRFAPSTDWSQGGPIIERERINVYGGVGVSQLHLNGEYAASIIRVVDGCSQIVTQQQAKTPLIAAMRAYVASKYGDEVPDALQAGISSTSMKAK